MVPAVVRLLFLQLVLMALPGVDTNKQFFLKNFHSLNIDYPKVKYSKGFQGYCNGFMAYVRGKIQKWYCPKIHYVIHAPWEVIRTFCKYSENFCENYNGYCTLTQDSYPLTVCSLDSEQPPTNCRYNSDLTNQRLYLLCSRKYDAVPKGIIGLH
ncbi:probable inactive ribonuclease-like protein 13 [Carlito syrichta]|uniref:Probable inactive ribonuclease-like protein 13 n=1 Tax=Carlito syrichta TaxID=1868482 RepID=A0A1U7TE42_CARSF|nr:probable inactive ribonuclease-like protein 13 [Carlito syrichta]